MNNNQNNKRPPSRSGNGSVYKVKPNTKVSPAAKAGQAENNIKTKYKRVEENGQKNGDIKHVRQTEKANITKTSPALNLEQPGMVRYKGSIDRGFLALVLILICFGSIMVFSASYAYSMSQDPGNGYIYVKRQILYVLLGLAAMFGITLFDTETIRRLAPFLYWGTIVLLALVILIGFSAGGAQRWIRIGSFSVQPSEIAKVTLAMMLAVHMDKYSKQINDNPDYWNSVMYGIGWPMLYILPVCALVAAEKHLSGTLILFLIGVVVIWAGGANKKFLFLCGGIGGGLLAAMAFLVPYTRRRIDILFHPENDPTGAGWQTLQGLRAIGSGGLFGLGPTNSRQKYMYVSQPQNDFIFSILCEELGYIGAMAVIILFAALIIKGYKIAMKAPDMFTSLVVTGIVSKVGIQAAFNIGVVTNTLPNTGISLPFFSYGGSSTIVLLAEMGIILSISRFSRQDR